MMNEINDKNEMTEPQAQHLAAFLNLIRKDWDTKGIVRALGVARGRGPADALAVAAIRAACDPLNRTPAVIGQSGRHWVGAFREVQGPPRENVCVEHGVVESRCRKHHRRRGTPDWWEDFRRGAAAPPDA